MVPDFLLLSGVVEFDGAGPVDFEAAQFISDRYLIPYCPPTRLYGEFADTEFLDLESVLVGMVDSFR